MKSTRTTTWTWTNWTFGLWRRKFKRANYLGIDAGPLEIVWKSPTRQHRESVAAFEARQWKGS